MQINRTNNFRGGSPARPQVRKKADDFQPSVSKKFGRLI